MREQEEGPNQCQRKFMRWIVWSPRTEAVARSRRNGRCRRLVLTVLKKMDEEGDKVFA